MMCNCISFISGYGISTVFAIIRIRSDPNLGSTNPGMIIIAQETLDFRCAGFSPAYILLIPTFSLVVSPQKVPFLLQPDYNAPLPPDIIKRQIRVFGTKLSPNTLSAQDRLTSELLRFL